MQMMLNRLLIG